MTIFQNNRPQMNDFINDVVSNLKRATKQHHLHIPHTMKPDAARNQIRDFMIKITPIATSGQSDLILIAAAIPKSRTKQWWVSKVSWISRKQHPSMLLLKIYRRRSCCVELRSGHFQMANRLPSIKTRDQAPNMQSHPCKKKSSNEKTKRRTRVQ